MANETVQAEKVVEIPNSHTVFSLKKPTPMWATWMFRTQFILNKVIVFYLTGTEHIGGGELKEILLILAAIDLGTWMFAKSLGVKKDDVIEDVTN